MLIGVAPHDVELGIENVLSVSSVLNAVIDDKLDHDLLGLFAVERQVLTIARDNVSISLESLLDSGFAI